MQSKNSIQNMRKMFPSLCKRTNIPQTFLFLPFIIKLSFQSLHFFSLCVKKQFLRLNQTPLFLMVAHIVQNLGFHIQRRIIIFRVCSCGGELARLSRLARLGEAIFIPRSHRIFYLRSIKKFEKPLWRTNMFLYYLINLWKVKQNWLKKMLSHLARLAHLWVFLWKMFISPRWDPGKIKWHPT